MTALQDKIARLPSERREKVAVRTKELIREEMILRDLKLARGLGGGGKRPARKPKPQADRRAAKST